MNLINNTLVASPGKFLMYGSELAPEFTLGKKFVYKNGKTELVSINLGDVKEVYPVKVQGITYYISATTYGDIISELIRLKYTLDDELALYANYRIKGETEEEKAFLDWRKVCKEVAKNLTNE